MGIRVPTLSLVLVSLLSTLIGFTFSLSNPETVRADGSNVTGTYFADDGSVYFLQQNGTDLWWAGFSLDSGHPSDEVFHRGVAFTNTFKGTILSDNTVFGSWAEVPRGALLRSGTATLQIGTAAHGYQLKVLAETGGLSAKQLSPSAPISEGPNINSRFLQVVKGDDPHSLNVNGLQPYRDETVFYGRVLGVSINGGVKSEVPSVDDTNGERSYSNFICDFNVITQTGHDHDLNLNVAVIPADMYFTTLGWDGINPPQDITSKLWDATAATAAGLQPGEGYIHAEALMYGHTAPCGASNTGRALFPGWADKGGNSILLNGQPVDAYEHPENLKVLHGQTSLEPVGLLINNVQVIAGSQIRMTGVLILDCGHTEHFYSLVRSCYIGQRYIDDNNSQNQEIHPIYSIDVINPPLGDGPGKSRNNLTGVWGDHQNGGTHYIRQIGNSIWMLSLTRTRASLEQGSAPRIPNDSEVFFGTIGDNADGSATITGRETNFQYGMTSNGWGPVDLTMAVDPNRKVINTNFHGVILDKLYEPPDTTPPVSSLTVSTTAVVPGRLESARVIIGGQTQTAKQVTIRATDLGSGVQNIWYRYYANGTAPTLAYTFASGPDATFTLPNPSETYRVDFFATDNAGNDENPKFALVDFRLNLPPGATHPVFNNR